MSWDDAIDGVDRDTPGGRIPRALRIQRRIGARAANDDPASDAPAYAELHCLSDFSFLRGASRAEDLFTRAAQCGYQALAITDECSLAGIVRAHEASKATGIKLIVGAEFKLEDGLRCVLLVENMAGYTALCRLITTARCAASKGAYKLTRRDVEAQFPACLLPAQAREKEKRHDASACPLPTPAREGRDGGDSRARHHDALEHPVTAHGLFALWLPGSAPDPAEGRWLQSLFGHRAYLAVELHRDRDDAARLRELLQLAGELDMVPVATGDAHMATRRERVLQDTVTAIRHGLPLADAGTHLFPNGERHLRTRRALGNVYAAIPGGQALLQAAVDIAGQCSFSMEEVKYVYPRELVPEGETPTSWLRTLVKRGMAEKWPRGAPLKVVRDIGKELALIAELQYEAFFLTVHDIVCFARRRDILCQGRGSSANSAVCYVLGITSVNPAESRLLMARFLSRARKEPPDIDVDFEHERREEVVQYIYAKYGRERAALAATVIRYRGKSAVRDVAKAFGLPPDQIALLAECRGWGNGGTPMEQRLRESGFDPDNPLVRRVMAVTDMLEGHPRHLSQHVGGFIISDAPLWHLVPVENAAMDARTVIQWEKDDLEALGLLKVDCLALGMLTCIRKALDLVRAHRGRDLALDTIPSEDAPTYAMIQAADTVGVFQIESRAQMSMLPRLKPACFYDLVIEVAIVRPGPIQGGMVHPYLRRRQGKEAVTYPSKGIEEILGKTLGVPLFQEQVMELVIHAGYSEEEADGLRRSMAAWRQGGDMDPHRERIRELMSAKGYAPEFIEQIFEQIKGFGSYGFPQSHAASFAKLVYASCWLKRHEPAAFACALLNAQPMGFYSPSQIVQDARRGRGARVGVEFLPVDVRHSIWDNSLVASATVLPEDAFGSAAAITHPNPPAQAGEGGEAHAREGLDPHSACLLPLLAGEGRDGGAFRAQDQGAAVQRPRTAKQSQPAIRLGFRQVHGLSQDVADAIVAARLQRPFADVADLCRRARLDAKARSALAEVGALDGLAGHRNAARWQVAGVERAAPLDALDSPAETRITLPAPTTGQDVLSDYRATGLTLGAHPLSLLRARLQEKRVLDSRQLRALPHGRGAFAAGLVTQRQRPATAKGTIFVTLEDEHGMVNVVVWQDLAARRRKALLGARLLGVRGRWEQVDGVQHLIARDLQDLSPLLGGMQVDSRDFR
jgi:error-prone DNA polymerase